MPTFENESITGLVQIANVLLAEDAKGNIRLDKSLRNTLDKRKNSCEEHLDKLVEKAEAGVLKAETRLDFAKACRAKAQSLDIQLEMFGSSGEPTLPLDDNGRPVDAARHSQRQADAQGGVNSEWEREEELKRSRLRQLFAEQFTAGAGKDKACKAVAEATANTLVFVKDYLNAWIDAGLVRKNGKTLEFVESAQPEAAAIPEQTDIPPTIPAEENAEPGEAVHSNQASLPQEPTSTPAEWSTKPGVPDAVRNAIAMTLNNGGSQIKAIAAAARSGSIPKPVAAGYFDKLERDGEIYKDSSGVYHVTEAAQELQTA
jgi:hypothetical protein